MRAQGVLGDRFCAHKAEFNRPIELPGDGAGGSGALNRAFQYAGNCVRPNDAARDHGCYRKSVFPSPQAVISCGSVAENASLYPLDAGCNGGNSVEAWRFFRLTGAPPMERGGAGGCVPYTSAGCVTPGGDPNNDGCRACAGLLDQCADSGLPPVMYKAASYGMVNRPALPQRDDPAVDRPPSAAVREREANIMREILANGPVLGCIFDYANFGARRFLRADKDGIGYGIARSLTPPAHRLVSPHAGLLQQVPAGGVQLDGRVGRVWRTLHEQCVPVAFVLFLSLSFRSQPVICF